MRTIAEGLRFPEGPIAMDDGSVLLVEIERGTLSRVAPDGTVTVAAECGGGPNGAAIGPDGAVYVCNNGGFGWRHVEGMLLPGMQAEHYTGGSIQRVDLASGAVTTLYTECEGWALKGPNDL
ncbi:MAG: SMP-30/gluconolactonase/LRE family protein, partial [Acidimicrobiia bacterium]|nr:SMP-30/gluconolactonase/LRE family protein [Acidimicrobiia bacterium]